MFEEKTHFCAILNDFLLYENFSLRRKEGDFGSFNLDDFSNQLYCIIPTTNSKQLELIINSYFKNISSNNYFIQKPADKLSFEKSLKDEASEYIQFILTPKKFANHRIISTINPLLNYVLMANYF